MTALAWLIGFGAAAYGVLLLLLFLFQRRLLYFPDATRRSPASAGLPQAREATFQGGDGEALIAWTIPPRGDKPVIIYFQGNAGGLDLRAERFTWLTQDGTGLVALCYRGYGGSSGAPTEDGLIRDAHAAYDFAVNRYPDKRIVVFGESLGTAVAVALAAERAVAGVILDAPFTSAAEVGASAYPFAPVRRLMKDQFHSDRRIARVTAPLLVLHGERDAIVPIRFGEKIFALANEPKRMVRFSEGGHVNLDGYGAAEAIKEFLASLPAKQ